MSQRDISPRSSNEGLNEEGLAADRWLFEFEMALTLFEGRVIYAFAVTLSKECRAAGIAPLRLASLFDE